MTTVDPADAPSAAPAPVPVTPIGAAAILAGALAVAALLSVSVARLVPGDAGDEVAIRREQPIPVTAAPAPGLAGVAPLDTFDEVTLALAPPWEVAAGTWAAAAGTARPTDVGTAGALAVRAAPEGATTVQATLTVPRPGAGVVASYEGPDSYVALVVGRTSQTIEMVAVEGDPTEPRRLAVAPLLTAAEPIVLALQRGTGGVVAIANGDTIGRRIVAEPAGDWRVGLVSGFRGRASEARFDDLTVA